MGEVDYIEEKWINNPIILIDFERLKEFFSTVRPYENINKNRFGEGLFLEFLKEPTSYHIFGLNMKEREEYIKQLINKKDELKKNTPKLFSRKETKEQIRHIDALKDYLQKFVNNNRKFFTDSRINEKNDNDQNPAFYLCPASWKALSYYFSDLYRTKAYKGAIGE